MPNNLTSNVTNASGAAIAKGAVCRISAVNAIALAQANAPASYAGLAGAAPVGIPIGYPSFLVTNGEVEVLLEPALVPAAGEELYLSATHAGRATNVAPGTAIVIGVVKSAAPYASTSRVLALLDLEEAAAAFPTAVESVTATSPLQVDNTDPLNPVVQGQSTMIVGGQATEGGGGAVTFSLLPYGVSEAGLSGNVGVRLPPGRLRNFRWDWWRSGATTGAVIQIENDFNQYTNFAIPDGGAGGGSIDDLATVVTYTGDPNQITIFAVAPTIDGGATLRVRGSFEWLPPAIP